MLGLKEASFLKFHADRPEALAALEAAIASPSLYDDALAQMAKAGLPVPAEVLNRDVTRPYEPSEAVEAAWLEVYRDTETYWALYQLAEKLVDLDDALLTWRHKHVVTVERIIGRRRGTGGTEGAAYLASTLTKRCFPELWSLSHQTLMSQGETFPSPGHFAVRPQQRKEDRDDQSQRP